MENNRQNSTNINWYPGHMAKTKRQILEKIDLIDVVLEVVDARIPKSSKIEDISTYIKNKPKLMILSKYDLCDKKETGKWIAYYEKEGYIVLPMNLNKDSMSIIIKKVKELMSDKYEKMKLKGLQKRKARVLVVGIPNVGKSTLINRLAGKKCVSVGNKPGVTTSMSWIRINETLELLDTPGILWPKFEGEVGLNLASLTAIKEEILPLDQVCIYILETLSAYYPEKLKERYNIEYNKDIIEALEKIGQKRGCIQKGGEVDYDKVYHIILNDMKEGIISSITFDRM